MVNESCVGLIKFEGLSMRLKRSLAAMGVAVVFGLASHGSAEAGGFCWGPNPGPCDRGVVSHRIYAPQYRNVYYMAQIAPDPYPQVYVPRGYWPRYRRPYARYNRRFWRRYRRSARRLGIGCCAPPVYAVPAPIPVPVDCGWRCRRGYLK